MFYKKIYYEVMENWKEAVKNTSEVTKFNEKTIEHAREVIELNKELNEDMKNIADLAKTLLEENKIFKAYIEKIYKRECREERGVI